MSHTTISRAVASACTAVSVAALAAAPAAQAATTPADNAVAVITTDGLCAGVAVHRSVITTTECADRALGVFYPTAGVTSVIAGRTHLGEVTHLHPAVTAQTPPVVTGHATIGDTVDVAALTLDGIVPRPLRIQASVNTVGDVTATSTAPRGIVVGEGAGVFTSTGQLIGIVHRQTMVPVVGVR